MSGTSCDSPEGPFIFVGPGPAGQSQPCLLCGNPGQSGDKCPDPSGDQAELQAADEAHEEEEEGWK